MIPSQLIAAEAWFDGERLHRDPIVVGLAGSRIVAVHPGVEKPSCWQHIPEEQVGFLCPGLVDAHVHLCLDGDVEDIAERSRLAQVDASERLAIARRNLFRQRAAGVTLVCDAGEREALNSALRDDDSLQDLPRIRSAAWGLRAAGRYGSFFAREWSGDVQMLEELAGLADVGKLVLTGIIDFAAGRVKGGLQFSPSTLQTLVAGFHQRGLRCMAHCSGDDGIEQIIQSGVDAVEHGFFMRADQVERLAGRSWTPTWWAVAALFERPQLAGLDEAQASGLARILDSHHQRLAQASRAGVVVLTGSDAGSLGVPHGRSLWREMQALCAAGWSVSQALSTATLVPRRFWGLSGGRIAAQEPADLAAFAQVPEHDFSVLQQAEQVWLGGRALLQRAGAAA